MDDTGRPVYSIYEMADAVCVLRECILITDFFVDAWDNKTAPRPGIAELASEAGRDTQAALFFDRLLRFLRHPFDGPLAPPGLAARFAVDVESRSITLLHPKRNWGPYMINAGIERVEAQISAYHTWLEGGVWQEPPPTRDWCRHDFAPSRRNISRRAARPSIDSSAPYRCSLRCSQ